MGEVSKGLEEVGTIIKLCKGGYGFIRRDKYPKKCNNAFFHASSTQKFNSLEIGTRVLFKLSQMPKKERKSIGQKNPSALEVRGISSTE